MTISTPPKNIRLTITVTPEVHASFTKFAKAASIPVGRAMGEWLGDTIDAVEFTAQKMQEARQAPALVTRELHAYAMGLSDEATAVMSKLRDQKLASRMPASVSGRAAAVPASNPPPSNTGGKGTQTATKKSQPSRKKV